MLRKKERLTRLEFDRSFAISKRIHTPYLQILFTPSSSFHGSVVVSKKVYKKAVDRNKLRRQLYALLYQFYKEHNMAQTYILITKPEIVKANKGEFSAVLKEGLKRSL